MFILFIVVGNAKSIVEREKPMQTLSPHVLQPPIRPPSGQINLVPQKHRVHEQSSVSQISQKEEITPLQKP